MQQSGFDDTFFADDLTCFRDFNGTCDNETVKEELTNCQLELHTWGSANQVVFDAGKESMHVLHRRKPDGESFRGLGVLWDTKLKLEEEVHEVAVRAN